MTVLPGPGAPPAAPPPAPVPAARAVLDDVRRRGAVFADAARRVRRRSDDEAIHDLRVASRRLVAALDLWAPLLCGRPRRGARRAIRRLRRRIGPAREREVMSAMLAARLAGRSPAVRAAAARPLERLLRRVERGRAAAARRASERRVERLRARLERALAVVEARAVRRSGWLEAACERADGLRADAHAVLAEALATGDDATLHAARIALKRWRYAEECLCAAGAERPADPARLRAVQQALGDLHDAAVLRDRLARLANHRAGRRAPDHAAALIALAQECEGERRAALARLREMPPLA